MSHPFFLNWKNWNWKISILHFFYKASTPREAECFFHQSRVVFPQRCNVPPHRASAHPCSSYQALFCGHSAGASLHRHRGRCCHLKLSSFLFISIKMPSRTWHDDIDRHTSSRARSRAQFLTAADLWKKKAAETPIWNSCCKGRHYRKAKL